MKITVELLTTMNDCEDIIERFKEHLKDLNRDYSTVDELFTSTQLEIFDILWFVANVEDTETLDKLAKHDDTDVVCRVAENTSTSAKTLDKLAKHKNFRVVSWVAWHPNTSVETLDKLAEHHTLDVVWNVAKNTNTSKKTLMKLAIHNNLDFVYCAKSNLENRK